MTQVLGDLLKGLEVRVSGRLNRPIDGLELNSSRIRPNGLFVAIVGSRADGHVYVADAVARGAAAVVVSRPVDVPECVTRVEVADTREALAVLAARFFGDPSRELTLVGLTGTNGKTTTSYLLEAVLRAAGQVPGVIGTVNYRYREEVLPAPNTTPEPVTLQKLLAEMKEAGVKSVVAEVSSHALVQGRVDGLHFDAALFTNLSRDHLDYHSSLEDYFEAKARLFESVMDASAKTSTLAVVNVDDPFGARLRTRARADSVWGFSQKGAPDAEIRVRDARIDLKGISADLVTPVGEMTLVSSLMGKHSLENLVGATGIALGLGINREEVAAALEGCTRIPGRLEEVPNQAGFKVLVDYAHTDQALRNVLGCLRPLTNGALISVFGCGGERDRGKRPLMGEAAASVSELSVVTTDNPRGEKPEDILSEILPGVTPFAEVWRPGAALRQGERRYTVIPDRREAIRVAIRAAKPGDVVLIAGKGHEDYQIVGDRRVHLDDREEALAAYEAAGIV